MKKWDGGGVLHCSFSTGPLIECECNCKSRQVPQGHGCVLTQWVSYSSQEIALIFPQRSRSICWTFGMPGLGWGAFVTCSCPFEEHRMESDHLTTVPRDLSFSLQALKASPRTRWKTCAFTRGMECQSSLKSVKSKKGLWAQVLWAAFIRRHAEYQFSVKFCSIADPSKFPSELSLVGIRWELQPSEFSIL